MTLTRPGRETLHAIQRYHLRHGRPPTLQEIADELGVRKSTLHERLSRLRRRGAVTWSPRLARTLCVTPAGRAAAREPYSPPRKETPACDPSTSR